MLDSGVDASDVVAVGMSNVYVQTNKQCDEQYTLIIGLFFIEFPVISPQDFFQFRLILLFLSCFS